MSPAPLEAVAPLAAVAPMLPLPPPLAQAGSADYFGWVIAVAMMAACLFAVGRASRRG
jgi:hypothetical protein